MLYSVLPITAGFLPVLPDARGAKVLAILLTCLSMSLLLLDVLVVAATSASTTTVGTVRASQRRDGNRETVCPELTTYYEKKTMTALV